MRLMLAVVCACRQGGAEMQGMTVLSAPRARSAAAAAGVGSGLQATARHPSTCSPPTPLRASLPSPLTEPATPYLQQLSFPENTQSTSWFMKLASTTSPLAAEIKEIR